MKHEFDDALRADPERFELAQKAAKRLDELTTRTVVPAIATWRVPLGFAEFPPSNNRALVQVEVKDLEGTSRVEFIGERERDNYHEMGYRIAHLWGDLLEERSYRYFQPPTSPDATVGSVTA